MTAFVETLATAAQPWADLYGGSAVLAGIVAFVHVGGLLVAGGLALAADRGVLRHGTRPWAERRTFLGELAATHGVVLAGLAAVVVSGLLMLAADVEALLPSPVFWAKMGGFALLLLNGLVLQKAERAVAASADPAADAPADAPDPGPADGERRWRALRMASVRSAALWFAVLFLGTLLTAVA